MVESDENGFTRPVSIGVNYIRALDSIGKILSQTSNRYIISKFTKDHQ